MRGRSGFTLIELLAVMGIMVLLMGISTMGFLGMRRGAELRGGAVAVRSTLMLARQQAVNKRQTVQVNFSSPTNMIVYSGDLLEQDRVIYFTPGIRVTASKPKFTFKPSGEMEGGVGKETVTIQETPAGNSKVIEVWRLTGASKEL